MHFQCKEQTCCKLTILQAVLLGERVTGNGAVQQLEISATGVPLWEIEPVLGVIVLALCLAAVWPSTVKVEEGKPKPGFLERIQNVSGRFACLGLAGTITAEVVTGKVLQYTEEFDSQMLPSWEHGHTCLSSCRHTASQCIFVM